METELIYDTVTRCVSAWKEEMTREETSELIIPDSMPDAAAVLDTLGIVYIRSKDVQAGKCRIEGLLKARILYRPEDAETVQVLSSELPFSFTAENAAVSAGDFITPQMKLIRAETRILNSRKLQLRAEIACTVEGYAQEERSFPVDTRLPDMELLKTETALECITACTTKTFVTTDELTLPSASPTVGAVLGYQFSSHFESIKQIQGKAVVQGAHEIRILYVSDKDPMPRMEHFTAAFSQIVDAPDEEIVFETVQLMPIESYLEVEPSEAGAHVFSLEIHISAACLFHTAHRLPIVSDAYSIHHPCTLEYQTVRNPTDRRCLWARDALREEIDLPYAADRCVYSRAEAKNLTTEDNTLHMALVCHLVFITESGALFSVNRTLPVEYGIGEVDTECMRWAEPQLSDPEVTVRGDKADIRLPWEVQGDCWCNTETRLVSGIVVEEEKPLFDRPASIVMVRRGERSLWDIAKRYGSRIVEIEAANGDAADGDKLLLIPHVR